MHTKRRLLDVKTPLRFHHFRLFVFTTFLLCIINFTCLIATAQSVNFSDSEMRTWNDPSRFYKVTGTLTESNPKTVKLKLENETTIEVPVDQLHDEDKKYVRAKVNAEKSKAKSTPAIARSSSTQKSTRVPFFANQVSLEAGTWSYKPPQKNKSVATALKTPIVIEKAFQDPQLQTGMAKLTFHSMQLSDDGKFCTMVFASKKDDSEVSVLKRVSVANGRTVAETVIPGMPLAVIPQRQPRCDRKERLGQYRRLYSNLRSSKPGRRPKKLPY